MYSSRNCRQCIFFVHVCMFCSPVYWYVCVSALIFIRIEEIERRWLNIITIQARVLLEKPRDFCLFKTITHAHTDTQPRKNTCFTTFVCVCMCIRLWKHILYTLYNEHYLIFVSVIALVHISDNLCGTYIKRIDNLPTAKTWILILIFLLLLLFRLNNSENSNWLEKSFLLILAAHFIIESLWVFSLSLSLTFSFLY